MNKTPALINCVARRSISTTGALASKKNFRKFYLPNERGTRKFREMQKTNPNPKILIDHRGVRETTIVDELGHIVEVQEKVPEMIVPDLTNFNLKPYVSYRTSNVVQSEFTPEDLFNAVYSTKILDDWNKKQLNEDGTSKKPSEEELLDAEEAFVRARKTGSDYFGEKPKCTL